MMDTLIARFPDQLKEALEIGRASQVSAHNKEIHNIYLAGMGGSGIGGNFVAEFVTDELSIPFTVRKGYTVPHSVTEHTLAIISSYSGNTEETIAAFEIIQKRGAKIVVVSSGGKLIQAALEHGYDYIQVPGDWPSPRACLGFSLVQQVFILNKLGFIGDEKINSIEKSITLIQSEEKHIKEEAKKVADRLNGKIPIIYTPTRMEPVALRFKQQINENAKMLCWYQTVPEMNHNELVGWRKKSSDWAVVYLRNEDDSLRNAKRMDISKEIISDYSDTIIELYSKGNGLIEKSIYFIHLVDWITYYLSALHGVDSIEVDVIDFLKASLAKL